MGAESKVVGSDHCVPGPELVHSCVQLEGFLEVVETDHLLVECVQFEVRR